MQGEAEAIQVELGKTKLAVQERRAEIDKHQVKIEVRAQNSE